MKRLFSVTIPIVVIISFILFMQQPTIHNIVNAQTVENEIIENTLEKTTAGIIETSKAMKNASELITNSIESSNKLNIDIGLPPIDFSKILKESNSLIEVEYQSAYSVILRANEETLL